MLVHVAASKKISDAKTKAAGIDIDRQNADDEVHVIRRMKESQFRASRGYSWFMDIIPIPEQVAKQTMEWNGMGDA